LPPADSELYAPLSLQGLARLDPRHDVLELGCDGSLPLRFTRGVAVRSVAESISHDVARRHGYEAQGVPFPVETYRIAKGTVHLDLGRVHRSTFEFPALVVEQYDLPVRGDPDEPVCRFVRETTADPHTLALVNPLIHRTSFVLRATLTKEEVYPPA